MTLEDQDALSCECLAHHGKHCDNFPLCCGTEGVDQFRVARLEAELDVLKTRADELLAVLKEAEAGLWLLATSGNKAAVKLHANARAAIARAEAK